MGPASYNYDESMTTLRYANRAKNIKNIPKINEDPKDAKMREYKDEIDKLKKQLAERGIGKWFLILSNFLRGSIRVFLTTNLVKNIPTYYKG